MIIAWRKLSRRSRNLARWLGAEIKLIPGGPPYAASYMKTARYLEKTRPRVVIGQLPQGPLLWTLTRLRRRFKYLLAVDIHTGFLVHDNLKSWILNKPFRRMLREVDLAIIHNDPMMELLPEGTPTLVVYDPPPSIIPRLIGRVKRGYLLVPAAWAPDEPLEYIVTEYRSTGLRDKGIELIITGDYSRKRRLGTRLAATPGVRLTGFLRDDEYYSMIAGAKAVIAATTREYTMLSAAWEALAYTRPIVASQTRTLMLVLGDAALYFKPGVRGSLADALERLMDTRLDELEARVEERRKRLHEKFEEQVRRLRKALGLG